MARPFRRVLGGVVVPWGSASRGAIIGARRLVVVAVLLMWLTIPGGVAPAVQAAADIDLPSGHFFPQTAQSFGPQYGYRVTDEAGIGLWSEFQRLGGVSVLGYPISRRFMLDGYVVQATQRVVMQWRPDVSPPRVFFLNTFDKLHNLGYDSTLQSTYQIPAPFDAALFDAGKTADRVIADRLALLNADPAIVSRYFSPSAPLLAYGLPTSTISNAGPFFIVRTQRGAIQHWMADNPGAGVSRGAITEVNAGDIAKQLGLVPADAALPETIAGALAQATSAPTAPPPSTAVTPSAMSPLPPPAATPSFAYQSKEVTAAPSDCNGDPTISAIPCLASAPNAGTQYIKGRVMDTKGNHLQWVTIEAEVAGVTLQTESANDGTFTFIIAGPPSPTGGCPPYPLEYQIWVLDYEGRQASDVRTVDYPGSCNLAGEFHFDFVRVA